MIKIPDLVCSYFSETIFKFILKYSKNLVRDEAVSSCPPIQTLPVSFGDPFILNEIQKA